jgi:uracil-DNA glycosylase
VAEFDGCVLRGTASHTILPEGDPGAGLVLVGEPPSADDDRSGMAFAGPAGEYLDRMLAAINLSRTQLMLTPLIPWRPPGDRPPSPTELAICLPFLHRLIALAAYCSWACYRRDRCYRARPRGAAHVVNGSTCLFPVLRW